MRKLISIVLGAVIAVAVYWSIGPESDLAKGLAILSFIAVLWITEAIHITATALLVPLLAVTMDVLPVKEALASFAHPIIFLFLGGFGIAAALHKHGLDKWFAGYIVRLARGNLIAAIGLLFLTTAALSMWISNTATTVMMLPIVLGMLGNLERDKFRIVFVFVLLGTAYSANIGGIGTLVGSPPNAIAASALSLDFVTWMSFGIPMVIILLPVMIVTLWLCLRPQFPAMEVNLSPPQTWSKQAGWVLLIFLSAVSLWIFSKPLSLWLEISKGFDAAVAIGAVVLLVGSNLVSWKEVERSADWGVLLLFGGGITLSVILSQTGASAFLANQLVELFAGISPLLFLGLAVMLMVFLTELASNTASAALLIPIFYSLPQTQIGLSPTLLSLSIAVAASCAFMLPVATPPNAIVFGTGLVQQRQMMRVGIFLNLVCIVVISCLMPWFI